MILSVLSHKIKIPVPLGSGDFIMRVLRLDGPPMRSGKHTVFVGAGILDGPAG